MYPCSLFCSESMEKQLNSSGIFSSLQILQEIQRDLKRKNIEPEEFTDRIVFMSTFNDIDWTKKGSLFRWRREADFGGLLRFLVLCGARLSLRVAGRGEADSSLTLRMRRSPTRAITIPESGCARWSSSWWNVHSGAASITAM